MRAPSPLHSLPDFMAGFQPHSFRHGPLDLEILAAPSLDALIPDDADADRLPFWAVRWSGAPALARYLADRNLGAGQPVLELGCGVGLTGLAAAKLGARVTQTDLFPEALRAARENARRNGVAGIRHVAADWRHWPLRGRWPLILGSDVMYERSCHPALLQVLERSLTPGGTVLLTDPGRPMSLAFLAETERAGWSVRMDEAAPKPGTSDECVWIYTLRRETGAEDQTSSR